MNELVELVKLLDPYFKHKDSCSIYLSESNPTSDFCTCGLSAARKRANELVNKLADSLNQ
jgi:hypothetical protein